MLCLVCWIYLVSWIYVVSWISWNYFVSWIYAVSWICWIYVVCLESMLCLESVEWQKPQAFQSTPREQQKRKGTTTQLYLKIPRHSTLYSEHRGHSALQFWDIAGIPHYKSTKQTRAFRLIFERNRRHSALSIWIVASIPPCKDKNRSNGSKNEHYNAIIYLNMRRHSALYSRFRGHSALQFLRFRVHSALRRRTHWNPTNSLPRGVTPLPFPTPHTRNGCQPSVLPPRPWAEDVWAIQS